MRRRLNDVRRCVLCHCPILVRTPQHEKAVHLPSRELAGPADFSDINVSPRKRPAGRGQNLPPGVGKPHTAPQLAWGGSSASADDATTKWGSKVGVLLLAVLLLVIMPALLYLIGRSVTRVTAKTPGWITFPAGPTEPRDKPAYQPRVAVKE